MRKDYYHIRGSKGKSIWHPSITYFSPQFRYHMRGWDSFYYASGCELHGRGNPFHFSASIRSVQFGGWWTPTAVSTPHRRTCLANFIRRNTFLPRCSKAHGRQQCLANGSTTKCSYCDVCIDFRLLSLRNGPSWCSACKRIPLGSSRHAFVACISSLHPNDP